MNNQSSQIITPSSRDYKCPCGKTYLSYAAIFTHIKQKHGGISPGAIEKPKFPKKNRGRPPLSSKKQSIKDQKTSQSKEKEEQQGFNGQVLNSESFKYYLQFVKIFVHLKEIEYKEYIEKNVWKNLQTFHKFQKFIDSRKSHKDFKYLGVCIGIGLSQFLKSITSETESWRFEQLLILFMLLLQYTIDENNDTNIISQAPIQFFIQYMNPFIKQFIQDQSYRLGIQSLWIMNPHNISKVFLCFYNWLKWKQYTQYCITLIGS